MLQLDNRTAFKAALAVLPDRNGVDAVHVVVKATLTLQPRLTLADEQLDVVMADEYFDDPTRSSLRQCAEMHIGKPGTDVLIVGSAVTPEARPLRRMNVGVSIAERRKSIVVVGDRVWSGGDPSEPAPFTTMPLVWERAFGGVQRDGEQVLAEERNPVGRGFTGNKAAREMEGQPLPNLEDPATPLKSLGQQATPACMGPIAPSWLPRRAFAGTYDANWQRTRAPYLPADFDPRFLQCACPELCFDRYLEGGEPIEISGMTQSPIAFTLPRANLLIEATIAGSTQAAPANLETLLVETDQNRAVLTWRASIPCDRKVLRVEKVTVSRSIGARE